MTGSAIADLSAADRVRVLECAERAIALDDLAGFAPRAASALLELVPCDFASYNVIDPVQHSAQLSTVPGDILFAGAEEAFARNIAEHPIVAHYARTHSQHASRLSDFSHQREFHKLALYDEVFRLIDNNYLLAGAPLVIPTPVILGFGLHRQSSDFSDRELALLDQASQWLAHAYGLALVRKTARAIETALEHQRLPVIVIDDGDRIVYATPLARDLLEHRFETRFPPGSPLPFALPLLERDDQALRGWHGSLAWECVRSGSQHVVILSERPVRETSSSHGLSAREDEILGLVAAGRTNSEIAELLFISIHTTRRHLESIYRKLGVHTRAAAATAFLRDSNEERRLLESG